MRIPESDHKWSIGSGGGPGQLKVCSSRTTSKIATSKIAKCCLWPVWSTVGIHKLFLVISATQANPNGYWDFASRAHAYLQGLRHCVISHNVWHEKTWRERSTLKMLQKNGTFRRHEEGWRNSESDFVIHFPQKGSSLDTHRWLCHP